MFGAATKKTLSIGEIRNDVVIMRDGTLRAVLIVSSINFALKSNDEQQAIISAYMQFLNSLTFPLQIVVQSRKMDISKYLTKLQKVEKEQTNDLLRMQIADYRKYIGELVEIGDIMSKRFYVVVPYDPLSDKQKSFWSRLQDLFAPTSLVRLSEERFAKRSRDLNQRVGHVSGELSSIGLAVSRLDTQALIELYYNSYNPDTAQAQPLANVADISLD